MAPRMDTDNDADSELLELPSEYTEQDNEAYEAFQNMSVSERELYLAGTSLVAPMLTRTTPVMGSMRTPPVIKAVIMEVKHRRECRICPIIFHLPENRCVSVMSSVLMLRFYDVRCCNVFRSCDVHTCNVFHPSFTLMWCSYGAF